MDLGGEEFAADVVDPDVEQCSEPNISDVLQAIEAADPERALDGTTTAPINMFGGTMHQGSSSSAAAVHHNAPYCVIREQPAPKALRFRYECEGRSAGSIPGANSTPEHKTFPTIEVVGYRGPAVVVVSCVTVDRPHKPHPHNLVGKDLCKDGVCTTKINPETMQVTFNNLGIQCVKKKDIEDALALRERIRVDPFRTGFGHKKQTQGIDLNSVRLCFQVFLEKDGRFNKALTPVVSDVIYDKKAMSDLTICRMSHCAASVIGGQEVFLLCEKVAKDDIAVRMFELNKEKQEVWSARADILAVHKQVAIVFRTPRYHNLNTEASVEAYVQLQKPSDQTSVSEARQFELKPMTENVRKRPRFSSVEMPLMEHSMSPREHMTVKVEPKEMSVQYGHQSPVQNLGSNLNVYRNVTLTPSPQHNIPTPSPPHYHYPPHASDPYSPQPGPAYSPQPTPVYAQQQWNIPVQQQSTVGGGMEGVVCAGEAGGVWTSTGAGESGEFSIGTLLHGGDSTSLRQLNSSDLEGFSFLPDSDVTDGFSRLSTDPDPDPFQHKNIL